MSPERLRKRLDMTRAELARALGVTERTVARWDAGVEPQGVAAEVFRAIDLALAAGVTPEHVEGLLRTGVSSILYGTFTGGFFASRPTLRGK